MPKYIRDPELRELKKDSRTGLYYVRKKLKGKKELCEALGTRSRTKARTLALESLARYMSDVSADPKSKPTFREIAAKWRALKNVTSKNTQAIYDNRLKLHLGPYFNHMDISKINDNTWKQYIADELQKGDRTLADDAKVMMGIMLYAFIEGLLPKKVRIFNPDQDNDERIAYSEEQIFKLLNAASTPDMRLQIQIGYTMGMRHGEIAHLMWDWIDFENKVIRLPQSRKTEFKTKTKRSRVVPINKDVFEELQSRASSSNSPCVFPSLENPNKPIPDFDSQWQRTWKRAGVEGVFHCLRHTCMTNMAAAGVPESTIVMIVGCSTKTMRKVYMHLKSDLAERAVNLELGHGGQNEGGAL